MMRLTFPHLSQIGDMFDNTMTAQADLHQHRQEPEKPQTSH
ncbi:hypothetical protein P3646_03055 [Vibrio parahaemolyticus]|nr:hypothetical protein [Vibrio parahaemolyticus]MDF5049747.1 hypothetical protein [Vibrio parahaemolyticus]MDF5110230.1 hypothetical protein [Vibrio parahaemolyticus]MDF5125260.1 hypothetical protein [Vibrio parahaemolyticus]MDF5129621.1 hypothetical protein [Vibrio parahaemolyticus]